MEYVHFFVLGLVMVLVALALLANRLPPIAWETDLHHGGQAAGGRWLALAPSVHALNSEVGLAVIGGFAAGFTKADGVCQTGISGQSLFWRHV